jgi:hypothetical protein
VVKSTCEAAGLRDLFLSAAERNYLVGGTANLKNDGYRRVIRSRLHKKVQQFISQELPLLVESGYVTKFCNVTENSNVEPACPFGHGIRNKNINIISKTEAPNTERGSPSLVGRGIANPMSERTRGFEIS